MLAVSLLFVVYVHPKDMPIHPAACEDTRKRLENYISFRVVVGLTSRLEFLLFTESRDNKPPQTKGVEREERKG